MKIGLVLPNVPAYSETFFGNKISGLQQHGHKVILFVNGGGEFKNYLNCRIVTAPTLGGNWLKVALKSSKQVLKALFINPRKSRQLYRLNRNDGMRWKESFKLILANQFLLSEQLDWLHFGFGTMAIGRENIAQVVGAQMAVSFRGYDYYVYPIKNPNCYALLFSKKAKYHVLSEAMKSGLVGKGISVEHIKKITPAVDVTLFNKEAPTANSIMQLTTISRLHPIKGLEYILEALVVLKTQQLSFQFSIIGAGTELERLQFAVHQLELTDCVTFLGKQNPAKVKEVLSQTNIYLQYSHQEGFCNAVLEAQAMGLLCIVSNAEGLSENVINNQTGWVVPKRNPVRLAKKIEEVILLSDSEKEKIKENAVKRIQKEFNLQKQQQEFMHFYTL